MKRVLIKYVLFYICVLAIGTMLFDVGFEQGSRAIQFISNVYFVLLLLLIIGLPFRLFFTFPENPKISILILEVIYWAFLILLLFSLEFSPFSKTPFIGIFIHKYWLFAAFVIGLIKEISGLKINLMYKKANPALIFSGSFFALILAGSFLLILPRATYSGISYTNALFTSTSAVCVTGLVVVDTGTYFTRFGQVIIMTLIQLGGIGIMTFTSFFAYFFKGKSSYQNLILLGNLTNVNKMSEVFGTLKKVIIFTLLIEAFGIGLIYLNLSDCMTADEPRKLFFSVFHSISAFCNAGFSTLSDSFYDIRFRYNYLIHLVIASLFIIGGLGFPVVLNFFAFLKYIFIRHIFRWNRKREVIFKAHVINLNTRLVVYTTLILIGLGTLSFFVLEYNNTLAEHQGAGKILTAFFGAVTPRTAGFNTVETGSLYVTTMILLIGLMWIGASPASTGGGIKTSTFALAVLNVISQAKGRNRVEIFRREIPELSLNRAFTFMVLSVVIIGIAVFSLSITEPDKAFADILFETFSAFGTVGLSRGITNDLSVPGRYIIMLAMFIGRVGTLTLLVAFLRKTRSVIYQYPHEEILIN